MRRVRRRGGNKEKVFGCDLLEHLNASCQEVPQVLRCCSEFVELHGIVDGIYRLSGVSSNIQRLRGEFESDGNPDLNKDVYLQDIHCISSLCKAYFRELPNPLLTYQLYDKFAEAVAIQLEEERLVKIRDVLKELPPQHYRTLEFLMRHLVRVASHSSQTNMHSRNLAIVWAPNLLRSKDIESTGFNGTAAFMEVRVQSIVVEFILTHVPQLFPEQGASEDRRKSLPSPLTASNQEDPLLKSVPTRPLATFGNISPGDGPLAIRPYHAIIEGTDKRKGSLKGRKWMSIFNIGGRFQDTRKRHKHSSKEKDRTALRPARSMDSLSIQSYATEGSKHPPQTPPSTNKTPLITSSPQLGSEAAAPPGGMGGSEYAVTYRRGTGLMSGGTQGTYTALDPEGLGAIGSEGVQTRSPGLSAKAGRRVAMHITGPTLVTVPLHITSNLALGVLQGGGSDRIIHRGRDKDGGDRVEGKVERKERKRMDMTLEGGRKVREGETDGVMDVEGKTEGVGRAGEEEEEKEREVSWRKSELVTGGRSASRVKCLNSNTDDEDANRDGSSDYVEMKSVDLAVPHPEETEPGESLCHESDILSSTDGEGDDHELSGYVQDNFEFLDHMDCCVMDHVDSSNSYQVNEFSVEPPGHSDDEYEVMVQAEPAQDPAGQHVHVQPGRDARAQSQTEFNPHRPLSLDLHSRHTKSLSLPYMTSPVHGPDESCSEGEDDPSDDDDDDDDDEGDYSSEEDDSMFVKSLPADFFLTNNSFELDTDNVTGRPADRAKSAEEFEPPRSREPSAREQERGEAMEEEEGGGLEGKQMLRSEEEDHQQEEKQRLEAEEEEEEEDPDKEKPCASKPSTSSCEKSITIKAEEEEEEEEEEESGVDRPRTHHPLCCTDSCFTQESADGLLEATGGHDEEETREKDTDKAEDRTEDTETACQEIGLDKKQGDLNLLENPADEDEEASADDEDEEEDSVVCSSGVWEELEDVVCKIIEESEQVQGEDDGAGEQEEQEEQEEQNVKGSGEKREEKEEAGTDKTEDRTEETAEQKLSGIHRESEEKETSKLQVKDAEDVQPQDREDNTTRETQDRKDNEDNEERYERLRATSNTGLDHKTVKYEESDRSLGGGGGGGGGGGVLGAGVGRKLVASKHPKIYQVRAVPVVPPKPQHCKLTAMTLRQQQREQREQRERGTEGGGENTSRVQTEQERVSAGEQGMDGARRRDGEDASRNSPLSMCFDEAVAIATSRRGKERSRDRGGEVL